MTVFHSSCNLSVSVGDGFSLDSNSQNAMSKIDRKLEGLMGAEEYRSIMAAPSRVTYESVSSFESVLSYD